MAGGNYVGKAGQLAAMAEFLLRGYNVAMPEVDVGDDIFVVHDKEGTLWRIQVKTAIGKRRQYGWSGQFAVDRRQLETPKKPELFYVFALRAGEHWDFLIVSRESLDREQDDHAIGTRTGSNVIFNFRFRHAVVLCSGRDFQSYRNNWQEWPSIPPPWQEGLTIPR